MEKVINFKGSEFEIFKINKPQEMVFKLNKDGTYNATILSSVYDEQNNQTKMLRHYYPRIIFPFCEISVLKCDDDKVLAELTILED